MTSLHRDVCLDPVLSRISIDRGVPLGTDLIICSLVNGIVCRITVLSSGNFSHIFGYVMLLWIHISSLEFAVAQFGICW